MAEKYVLGQRIGGGGMAEVFSARLVGAEGFARTVAIKRILPEYSAEPVFAEMFISEARIASTLVHPNVVSVLDFDRDDEGNLFLVMELVDGTDLRKFASAGALPIEVSAFIASEMLRGLAFVQERGGIVHRDISPHNVLISWDASVKISDFGIAKVASATRVTQSGLIKGKVGYMSPEQAEGRSDLDGRSDLFAVGIVLHELLSGARLFKADSDRATLNRILVAPIDPPSHTRPEVPPTLDAVCMRLLERDLDRRYATAAEALDELLVTGVITTRSRDQLGKLLGARKEDLRAPPRDFADDTIPSPQLHEPATRALPRVRKRSPVLLALVMACAAAMLGIVLFLGSDEPRPAEQRPSEGPARTIVDAGEAAPADETVIDAGVIEAAPDAGSKLKRRRRRRRERRTTPDASVVPDAGPAPKRRVGDGILEPTF